LVLVSESEPNELDAVKEMVYWPIVLKVT